jgi:hypothetical protein
LKVGTVARFRCPRCREGDVIDETFSGLSMGRNVTNANPRVAVPGGYALGRYLARQWVNSARGKIRLLRGEAIDEAENLLLVLGGSPSLHHAAAVAAALERPVRFLLPKEACRGLWQRWLASQLGVIWQAPGQADLPALTTAACEALGRGEAVALFAEMEPARSESLSPTCAAAATLALDVNSASGGGPGLIIVPLHVLDSYGTHPAGEVLLAAGSPIAVTEFHGGASAEASLRTLAGALEDGLSQNPLRLEERDLQFFLGDAGKLLRADLEEDWAARPNWKQTTEGFEISRFVVECAEELNARDPAALEGLRIELEHYREELRRWSLHQVEVECAGEWLRSPARRICYWMESVLEAPVAFYGFINHLIPIALLMPGSLVGRLAKKDPGHAWLLRVLVVLGTYIVLVSICAREWGRAVAGYYTLTLPLSGLVLWRFSRLVRTRVRLLLLARTISKRGERLRTLRKRFIENLNQARDRFAEAIRISP